MNRHSFISYAEYERRAAAYIARLGLPAARVDYGNYKGKFYHLKPKPTKKAFPRNGRHGRRHPMTGRKGKHKAK